MAKHNVDIGSGANAGDGDPIRTAFSHVNDNTDELYEGANITATAPLAKTSVADQSVTLSISDGGINEAKLNISNTGSAGDVLTSDGGTGFTWAAGYDGDITGVTAGDGLSGGGTSGNVTLSLASGSAGNGLSYSSGVLAVGVDDSTVELNSDALRVKDLGIATAKLADDAVDSAKIADGAVDTVHIADNNITQGKLENRYKEVTTSTSTGSQNLDASAATAFRLTGNVATATLTIQNMKKGQVIDILFEGTLSSAVITLAADFTTETFNKVGATNFDQSAKNLIQVVCIDDTDGGAFLNYSVAPLVLNDPTPAS